MSVEEDTVVLGSVESRSESSLGAGSSGTGDLDVDALGVVLGAVLLAGRVETDDLVAQDVVAVGDGLGDGGRPAVVVADQVVGGPLSGRAAAIDEALGVDLEELQRSRVDGGALAVAGGKVRDDGAVVALRPFSPLELNVRASLNGGSQGAGLAVLVADDVLRRVAGAVDETEVGGAGGPANGVRGIVGVGVFVNKVSAVAVPLLASFHSIHGYNERLGLIEHTRCRRRRYRRRSRDQRREKRRPEGR